MCKKSRTQKTIPCTSKFSKILLSPTNKHFKNQHKFLSHKIFGPLMFTKIIQHLSTKFQFQHTSHLHKHPFDHIPHSTTIIPSSFTQTHILKKTIIPQTTNLSRFFPKSAPIPPHCNPQTAPNDVRVLLLKNRKLMSLWEEKGSV